MLSLPSGAWATPPVIDSLSASSTITAPDGLVTLEVNAHDPDCASTCSSGCGLYLRSDLTAWSADGGTFVFSDNGTSASPYTATAQWQAPSGEGTFTLSVSVSDSGGMMCGGRQTTAGSLQVVVSSNPGATPVIESLVGDPVSLFPGESSQLTCSATDPDGDPLSYGWSTDFGVLTPGTQGSSLFVSPLPGLATVTCTATDLSGAAASESIVLSVSDVTTDGMIASALSSPHRLDVDSMGDLYVVDRGARGITAMRLETGDLMYRIPMPGASSVAVDWHDRLVVGTKSGAGVYDRSGVLVLDLGTGIGEVSDVAVDVHAHRFISLYRQAGRVVVHDEDGVVVAAFGETGDGPGQLMGPSGVAVTPNGHVVVADSGHRSIKVFDLDGNLVNEFGGTGGTAGQFVELDDVAVGPDGVVYASDQYQSWVQTFNPDGTLREVIGSYGEGPGEFMTPAGIASAAAFGKLVVASVNTPGIQVFQLGSPAPVVWPAPEADFSTSDLTFSSQAVGTTSGPLDVTVTNNGTAPLGIHEIAVSGPFAIVDRCDLIDPGEWCAFTVVFTPISPGPTQGSMTIRSSAGGNPFTVSISGSAFLPAEVVLSLENLEFTRQGLGTTSHPQSVFIHNPGTVPLTLSNIVWSGPFAMTSTCWSQLAGGASCKLAIEFAPESTGPTAGIVTIESSAVTSPDRITMSGEGILLELTPDPAGVDFGLLAAGGSGAIEPIQILNTGAGQVTLGSLEVVGDHSVDFLLATDHCSNSRVDPGQSCWVEIAFTPGTASLSSAQLVIPTDAGLAYDVSLSGGIVSMFADGFETGDTSAWATPQAKAVQAVPATVVFNPLVPGAESGSRVVTLRNPTGEATYLGQLRIQGNDAIEFVIDHDSCSSTWLEPGASCTIGVRMLTLNEGSFSAVLVVPAAVADVWQPDRVELGGTVRWPQ